MSPHGEYGDRLAALDARLSRLLDAVRRTRHELDNHAEHERTEHERTEHERTEHERTEHERAGRERAGQHRRRTGEQR
jgi:hypothetical protein